MTAPTTEVWFQHGKCGTVFQLPLADSQEGPRCAACGPIASAEQLTRHEFPAESPEFIQFLKGASHVYTSMRYDDLTEILARTHQTTPS